MKIRGISLELTVKSIHHQTSMNTTPLLTKQEPPRWLKILVISLLILGIFFRFAHLGHKVYWVDAAFTSLAISGHTIDEAQQEIMSYEDVISIATLDKFQQINPDRGLKSTLNYLINSEPQLPPLYCVIARFWASIFGDSMAVLRSLSAAISLLMFPAVYWLCLELFESHLVAWLAMALVAISPLELFFAQAARSYGLWMVMILLTSAALWRSLHKNTPASWAIYGLTLTLGLYTNFLTGLVAIAHGIYVLVQQSFHFSQIVRRYLLTSFIAILLFLPWIIVLLTHLETAILLTGWTSLTINTPIDLITIYLNRISRVFFDINLTSESLDSAKYFMEGVPSYNFYTISSVMMSLGLIIFLIFLFKDKSVKNQALFLVVIASVCSLSLLLADLLLGGNRSIVFRYHLPFYLCLQIAVAYVLIHYIFVDKTWQNKIAQTLLIVLVIFGISSDVAFFQAKDWLPTNGRIITQATQVINESASPLLLYGENLYEMGLLLTLSHSLEPKVSLLSVHPEQPLNLPTGYSHIFYCGRDDSLLQKIQQDNRYSLKSLNGFGDLWQINKVHT
ncbi:glycosyltransferase family 39 protein [Nostoc sp. CENA67]|uniref:Glycosyltransferase family 39 protein n=1 Tax=Amazonocrinis nigriterrae CENA67 TaxID=2794033 RepID=A0A8J7HPU8_9NOST|nr:glycosyltransferase family 39 protein [Amazonocrinis nigriterrae]MBH8561900.1 glycosyltransferase family 39 protein [Amazonocrinis nigriterrae CENA67]